jgi:UDP-hydrolysing UDP-N-acetyl-D-glucosamine 2-epimerase
MVVTGSRSEFGLLRPVMEAVKRQKSLALQVVVAGEHLLAPAHTWREVDKVFRIDARVQMQKKGDKGRADHAAACGRGVAGFSKAIKRLKPDWVVVLGDRIEAFAAASAASIAGVAVCHIHGGDRAEGVADEAMRHAITKLSHLHCAATKLSAERIVKMGEPEAFVHVTGSPAIDGLHSVKPMSDADAALLGDPCALLLLHPSGMSAHEETDQAESILGELEWTRTPTLTLAPNSDPGRETIEKARLRAIANSNLRDPSSEPDVRVRRRLPRQVRGVDNLPRPQFLSLLKRLAQHRQGKCRGVLIGNSSAGLIEAAAFGLNVVNVGCRQNGRERGNNVIDVPYRPARDWAAGPLEDALLRAMRGPVAKPAHPYGDGRAGPRIAALLAKTDPHDPALLRKRIAY